MSAAVVRDFVPDDLDAVRGLWERCGLLRPWNDPAEDIRFCRDSGHGALLVATAGEAVLGTVMVGHDGHRGWVYYLAVDPAMQKAGHGRRLMAAAEAWLGERGVPKVELMVRAENRPVRAFYRRLGYADSDVRIMERWLKPPKMPKPGPAGSRP